MQKRYNIRLTKNDEKELNRTIKNFNAKIDYQMKHHPDRAEFLPEKIGREQKREMLTEIKQAPRSEFKKVLKSIQSFSKKGAEEIVTNPHGVRMTKWEKTETLKNERIRNNNAKAELQKILDTPATSRGKELGYNRGMMEDTRTQNLKPKTGGFDKAKSLDEWRAYKEVIDKQSKFGFKEKQAEQFKENYLKAVNLHFGVNGQNIADIVSQFSAQEVVDIFQSDEQASIDFVYDETELNALIDVIEEVWQNAFDGRLRDDDES